MAATKQIDAMTAATALGGTEEIPGVQSAANVKITPAQIKTYALGAASALSAPAVPVTGAWITGGDATTTKPHALIEPTSTTSTGWSTAGTGLGINAASGFTGNLIDAQVAGVTKLRLSGAGVLSVGNPSGGFSNTGISALGIVLGTGGSVAPAGEQLIAYSSSAKVAEWIFGVRFKNNALFNHEWSSTSTVAGATDTNLSRISAGVVGVGTGAQGSTAGSLSLTNLLAAGYLKSGSYTVATVPSASAAGAGARIYVSDETGGATPAFSDATNWRRYADRAIIA